MQFLWCLEVYFSSTCEHRKQAPDTAALSGGSWQHSRIWISQKLEKYYCEYICQTGGCRRKWGGDRLGRKRNSIIWSELMMPAIFSSWEGKGCKGKVALCDLCARSRQGDIFWNICFKLLGWVQLFNFTVVQDIIIKTVAGITQLFSDLLSLVFQSKWDDLLLRNIYWESKVLFFLCQLYAKKDPLVSIELLLLTYPIKSKKV